MTTTNTANTAPATHTSRAETPVHARTMTGTADDAAAPMSGELLNCGPSEHAGTIVWWELHGDVDLAELHELHTATGGNAEELPSAPTSSAALRAALKVVAEARHLLVRADPSGSGWVLQAETAVAPATPATRATRTRKRRASQPTQEPAQEGTSPVAEGGDEAAETPEPVPASVPPSGRPAPPVVVLEAPEERLQHRTVAEVRSVPGAHGAPDTLQVRTLDEALASHIQDRYDYFTATLTPRDVAYWLPAIIARLDGVGLRQKGGVYFVPHTGLPTLAHIVRTLRAVSQHRVFQVPVMRADDAAEAFLDAMDREARAFAESAIAELPTLKANGRKTRLRDTQALTAKVSRYEALFGAGRLDSLRKILADLETACAIADICADVPEGAA